MGPMNFSIRLLNYGLVMLKDATEKAFLKIIHHEDHLAIALVPIVVNGTKS